MANSKYAYNRTYYTNKARGYSFDGNAARKLQVVPDEDYEVEDYELEDYELEDYEAENFEPEYEEPEQEYIPERSRRVSERTEHTKHTEHKRRQRYEEETEQSTSVRTRYNVEINLSQVMIFLAAVTILVFSAFRFIEVKSNISQISKDIKTAQVKLEDVNALNASLASALDTEIDRNYIYSVAVGKLGMVYPNENQIVTYSPADTGYVHQMSAIPGN